MKYTRNQRELQNNKGRAVRVIGLTGGIASGKTVATEALKAAGFTVIDADEISRELLATGTDGERQIVALFPEAADNGRLDRGKLRSIISYNGKARLKLNELTHPAIIAEVKKRIAGTKPPVVLSAPLLFESSLSTLCDVTATVYCSRQTRIQRLIFRDGITAAQAEAMIDAQIPDTERCTISDYIVPSDRDKDEFIEEITELFKEIVK